MALKPDRVHVDSTIDYFMDEVATRGGVVSVSTAGSGAAMDQSAQLVTYAAEPSGKIPVGLLMQDVVNLDLTRQAANVHKDEVQKGGKVNIWRKGTVVTDFILTGQTPTATSQAFLAHSGYISATDVGTDDTTSYRLIGRFGSIKDEDGYAKVHVNLP